jgi:hypothetical protein
MGALRRAGTHATDLEQQVRGPDRRGGRDVQALSPPPCIFSRLQPRLVKQGRGWVGFQTLAVINPAIPDVEGLMAAFLRRARTAGVMLTGWATLGGIDKHLDELARPQ